jgi:MSHA biogenesis protein MshI
MMRALIRSLSEGIGRVRWRTRPARARVAIELRAETLLALRMDEGRPTRLAREDCRPPERRAVIERLRRAGWFERAEVQLVLGPGQRQLNSTPRPPVDDADLREALRWQLRDALDYPPEEAVLDAMPVADTEPAGRQEILVFSVRRQELTQLVGAFAEAGVRLQRVAAIDCAQRNLAWHWVPAGGAAALLLPCEGGALCTVSRGEQLILSRAIELGGDLAPTDRRLELTAERIALQMQRSFDLLERRSADAAIAHLVMADWGPSAPLFLRIAALTAQRVQTLDVDAMYAPVAAPDAQADSGAQGVDGAPLGDLRDWLHLVGACLTEAPPAERAPVTRSQRPAAAEPSAPPPGLALVATGDADAGGAEAAEPDTAIALQAADTAYEPLEVERSPRAPDAPVSADAPAPMAAFEPAPVSAFEPAPAPVGGDVPVAAEPPAAHADAGSSLAVGQDDPLDLGIETPLLPTSFAQDVSMLQPVGARPELGAIEFAAPERVPGPSAGVALPPAAHAAVPDPYEIETVIEPPPIDDGGAFLLIDPKRALAMELQALVKARHEHDRAESANAAPSPGASHARPAAAPAAAADGGHGNAGGHGGHGSQAGHGEAPKPGVNRPPPTTLELLP